MSSGKWRPFCHGLNVLKALYVNSEQQLYLFSFCFCISSVMKENNTSHVMLRCNVIITMHVNVNNINLVGDLPVVDVTYVFSLNWIYNHSQHNLYCHPIGKHCTRCSGKQKLQVMAIDIRLKQKVVSYSDCCYPVIGWAHSEWHVTGCAFKAMTRHSSLQWRHNGRDSVSNHQPHDCLLNRLFRLRSKKTSKLRVTGLCVVNSPRTGEFPAQMASYAENVSIWWRHHVQRIILSVVIRVTCVGVMLAWLSMSSIMER